jgi:hypothetical protein
MMLWVVGGVTGGCEDGAGTLHGDRQELSAQTTVHHGTAASHLEGQLRE